MDAVCERGQGVCEVRALAAALHSLHLYCASISTALICFCAPVHPHWHSKHWRGQTARGVASVLIGVTWCCGASAASLRPAETVYLVSAIIAPLAWLAAAALHATLWSRRSAAPILYLAIYWLLSAISSAAILWKHIKTEVSLNHIEVYIQAISTILAVFIAGVDSVCFYDEVARRHRNQQKPTTGDINQNIPYKYNDTYFYSKIAFLWLNPLLYRGYLSPLDQDGLGDLPQDEKSNMYYEKFKRIYNDLKNKKVDEGTPNIWHCYFYTVWPNFYIAGILKLLGDLISVVPALGLAVIIRFIEEPLDSYDQKSQVTIQEYFYNGYIMLFIVTIALIIQALLSQNSTHLVTVEGTRLKISLQSMLYDKCMRLAPWSSASPEENEESPLLHVPNVAATTPTGLLTNLISQDTYNVMSCVWICHYLWAIPLKVTVILYLLYTKLGISAIIGTAVSVMFITPLQFFIGKKLSDNSKDIAKCTDHRISKITEILKGINVIKLYVWEDLFNEKILHLREVELRLLNKDSIYWSFLTFTTQVSTILVTMITFIAYYFMENSNTLTAYNVFAGLALFNQLSVPLLILPVTVLMVIQAMVSTRRIRDFLDLPESNNIKEVNDTELVKPTDILNNAFINCSTDDTLPIDNVATKEEIGDDDQFSDDENTKLAQENKFVVSFQNAVFSWGMKNGTLLEIDDLDIPTGKLIMVVGSTGSGKTSLLSAILGEMYLERGEVNYNGHCSKWYAGQPPWLLEASVRDNIVMNNAWCQRKYARVLRATSLRPDLQLLPEGDATRLGSHGTPLSGGQRVRVCVARAIYSNADLLALDEPLAALDAGLAQHVVVRAMVTAARAGHTVIIATNRLELLHYADVVIAMEDGRVCGVGRPSAGGPSPLSRWAQLAGSARAAAARSGVGPPGGSARERDRLRRALNRTRFQRCHSDNTMIGINEAAGAHLLTEVPTCAGGSWRQTTTRTRRPLCRQLSSPPPSLQNYKWRHEVRRAVSADASNTALQREASLLRRLLRPRTHRTLARWTPRTLRRLLSSEANTHNEDNLNNDVANETGVDSTYTSLTSNGAETSNVMVSNSFSRKENDTSASEEAAWCEYGRACGWWGALYWVAAAAAQALSIAADYWLMRTTTDTKVPLTEEQMWSGVQIYALWCVCGASMGGLAQAANACAGARARRKLHERLLHSSLHAPLHYHHAMPHGSQLHRFSADVQVIDKKLPIATSRWAQLALLCGAAMLVNAVLAPWSLLALIPAVIFYFTLQSVYLYNARELQREEAQSAASVVSLAAETSTGGATVRVGRLQPYMRAAFQRRLDRNQNALLLLNSANRWLGLSLDIVGAGSVCASLCVALSGGGGGGGAAAGGLAGAYALLLPAYLAHLAKCRADLHLQLAAVERLSHDTHVPQEDYKDDCPIPSGWQRDGKIEFDNVTIQPEPGAQPILHNINLSISPGQKIAICGRSGSGKSSLLLTCAGATTIRSGQVFIDKQDATRVPLRALRHRVVLMPQEPVLFSGTLRENLDPLAMHTDEEIWHSLKVVGLFDFVTAQPAGLECSVSASAGSGEGGWSAGWAARACAARAALHARTAGALLLDEPAAALHAPADRALLRALAAAAPHTTLLTVTHRISSVRGYDRAIVLEDGHIVEQGEVSELLGQPNSRLARMLATMNRER